MDLKNLKDNILAKANNGNELNYHPAEAGDNSMYRNYRNAALPHSTQIPHSKNKMNIQSISIGMGFNPSKINSIIKLALVK